MQQELKIKINNSPEIEAKLKALGANMLETQTFTDTYFNQPPGEVLKLADSNNGYSLVALKAIDGKFEMIKNEKLENSDAVKTQLANEYGIKCILTGTRQIFELNPFKITLNNIDNIGEFLIITGENPTEDFIVNKIGIQNPEYVNVSFDQLAPKA